MYKVAKADSLGEVRSIMKRIYEEEPEYWPYGLDVPGHDDVFMIREKNSNTPVGFVGWQSDLDFSGDKVARVGYYSIGILPEHRRKGFVKEAVQKIISLKSGSYDRVQAFIVEKNAPSTALAKDLGVDVINKVAGVGQGAGCLMLTMPKSDAFRIVKWAEDNIPEGKLANQGYERDIHVTVNYGFPADMDMADLSKVLKDFGPINLTLGKIHRFEANDNRPDSDVVHIQVESDDLQRLHAKLKEAFSIESNYPDYNPHVTLAYVQAGALKTKLNNHARFEGEVYTIDRFKYSTPGSERAFRIVSGEVQEEPTIKRASMKFSASRIPVKVLQAMAVGDKTALRSYGRAGGLASAAARRARKAMLEQAEELSEKAYQKRLLNDHINHPDYRHMMFPT
jgi:2'-5' RNA ligase